MSCRARHVAMPADLGAASVHARANAVVFRIAVRDRWIWSRSCARGVTRRVISPFGVLRDARQSRCAAIAIGDQLRHQALAVARADKPGEDGGHARGAGDVFVIHPDDVAEGIDLALPLVV